MQSKKRMFAILIAAFVVLGAATLLTATDNSMQGVALKQEITFTGPTVVGGSLLPAGDYKVLHEMQGTNHIMIFKQKGGTAEAKATCTLVPLSAKATVSEQRFTENANNQRVLVQMTFSGDQATHVLEP